MPLTERVAVSLFSGAGGLDLGLEQAGFRVRAQVEMERDSVGTLEARAAVDGSGTLVVGHRIEDVDPESLIRSLGLLPGEVDLLAGGPPCQPFTTTGLRQGLSDRRASSTFPAYLDYVRAMRPKSIALENVDGFLSAALQHRPMKERGKGNRPLSWEESKGSFLYWFLGELAGMGYSVSWGVLDAVGHGVAQHRQRAFLLGVLGDEPCFLPDETYGGDGQEAWRTLRDALEGVEELGPVQPLSKRKRDVFGQVPPGGNWRNLPDEVRRDTMGAAYVATGGKSGWWRRLSWDLPAPTMLGMPDHSSTALVHPDEIRCLSLNECAAVQSFPAGTGFVGQPRSKYQQVGNAVPPLLGHAIGKHLERFLSGWRPDTPSPPDWRPASANRRIGTHGWVTPSERGPVHTVIAKPRPDSVWVNNQVELELA